MKKLSIVNSLIFSLALSCAGSVGASTETLNHTVKGALTSQGLNNEIFNAGPGNTLVGRSGTHTPSRAYFVFDLASIGIEVVSARLETENHSAGYISPDPTETLTLYDYTSDIGILQNQRSISVPAFQDLGSGAVYGSQVVSDDDEGVFVVFDLTPAAIADINNARGSLFAIGLEMTTLDRPQPSGESEVFFAFSGNEEAARLVLELVPEPSSLAVVLAGMLSLSCIRQR